MKSFPDSVVPSKVMMISAFTCTRKQPTIHWFRSCNVSNPKIGLAWLRLGLASIAHMHSDDSHLDDVYSFDVELQLICGLTSAWGWFSDKLGVVSTCVHRHLLLSLQHTLQKGREREARDRSNCTAEQLPYVLAVPVASSSGQLNCAGRHVTAST